MISCSRVCLVLMLSVLVLCEEHIHHHHDHGPRVPHSRDGEHEEDFDHQAVLGSEDLDDEFEGLPRDVARRRLGELAKEHDLDSNGVIDKEELTKWITNSFKKLDREEAMDKFGEEDEDQDGKITWKEYLNKVYSFSDGDVEEMRIKVKDGGDKTDEDREAGSSLKMVDDDKRFFDAADLNKDGQLDHEEYLPFYYPQNYEHMHTLEIERFMKETDTDGDGKISKAEFSPEQVSDTEGRITADENFGDLDKDKDGFLSEAEVTDWVVPGMAMMVEDEVNHLIEMADAGNKDGKLSIEEILDKTSQFVGSSITDYGNLLQHDEL